VELFNVSPWHIAILLLAALFILGPDRLPAAAAWLGRMIRNVRQYADDTRTHLRSELGDDYDKFREPLEQLNSLRKFDPKRAVTSYLFDDGPASPMSDGHSARGNGSEQPKTEVPPQARPRLQPGEQPPFDAEAT
jgi:sec-independent protein translocase protein TatB